MKRKKAPKTILERAKAPTPRFFRRIRKIGIALGVIAGAVLAAPVSLPAGILAAAGYVATAGGVAAAVAQVVTKEDEQADD